VLEYINRGKRFNLNKVRHIQFGGNNNRNKGLKCLYLRFVVKW
jgi:hypothetical protein